MESSLTGDFLDNLRIHVTCENFAETRVERDPKFTLIQGTVRPAAPLGRTVEEAPNLSGQSQTAPSALPNPRSRNPFVKLLFSLVQAACSDGNDTTKSHVYLDIADGYQSGDYPSTHTNGNARSLVTRQACKGVSVHPEGGIWKNYNRKGTDRYSLYPRRCFRASPRISSENSSFLRRRKGRDTKDPAKQRSSKKPSSGNVSVSALERVQPQYAIPPPSQYFPTPVSEQLANVFSSTPFDFQPSGPLGLNL